MNRKKIIIYALIIIISIFLCIGCGVSSYLIMNLFNQTPKKAKNIELSPVNISTDDTDKEPNSFLDNLFGNNTKNSGYYSKLAQSHLRKKEYQKALEAINKSIKINSNNSEAYITQSTIYQVQNHYNKALNSLNKALAIDPLNPKIFFRMGLIYKANKSFSLAEQKLLQANELSPESTEIKTQLAQLYYQQNKFDKTINIYNNILENNPNDKSIYLKLGN